MDNVGLKKGHLELLDYDYNYSKIFKEEKANLEKIFAGKYSSIEHVGSTAIKGIKSKPIIDILIETKNLEDFKKYAEEFVESQTYTIKKEPTADGELLIRKEEDGKVKAFIHVYQLGDENAKTKILFRDYLNTNPDEAKRYEKLKMDLFEKYKDKETRKEYTAGKEEYIKEIINKAKKEYR